LGSFTVHKKVMASFDPAKALVFMALRQESQGLFEANGYKIFYTGLGKLRAAISATAVIQEHLKLSGHQPQNLQVINLGTAGSHTRSQGEVVECTRLVQRDPIFELFPSEALELPRQTRFPSVTCGTGDLIHFQPPPISCDVYDMEAYALASVCQQLKIPFLCLKYVSDSSDEKIAQDWARNLQAASAALLSALGSIGQEQSH
jgi:adenosylhomocysteine nucleosidase